MKDIKSTNYGGNAEPASATVMLPRSYFVQTFKVGRKDDKDPDAALLDAYISGELTKMTQNVRTCLGLAADAVHVDAYTDLVPVAAAAPQAAGTAVGLLFTDHVKEIALGVLALMSLFMVSNIVKKGTPVPVLAVAPAPVKMGPVTLSSGEEAVGEASEGNPLLDGMELDEDSVKAQQMLSQVGSLVDENPEAAAGLVKRWLNRA